jgi:hypothetical protein
MPTFGSIGAAVPTIYVDLSLSPDTKDWAQDAAVPTRTTPTSETA